MLSLLAGFGTGVVLSAPVGPMGVLAAYEAAAKRVKAAWLVALGGCVADSLLALLATWGTELPIPEAWLHGTLAVVMLALAGYMFFNARQPTPPLREATGFGVSLGTTLLHPANLLVFGLAFKWLSDKGLSIEGMADRLLLMAGVFCGALVIWGVVIHVAAWVGASVGLKRFQVLMKQGLAVVCLLTGLWALSGLL